MDILTPMTSELQVPTAKRAHSNGILGALRGMLILPFFIVSVWGFLVAQGLGRLVGRGTPDAALWVSRSCRILCRLMGIRVQVRGDLPPVGSLLVPNHVSYLDICALASVAPCLFVPKREVATWPVVGRMVRQAGFPIVSRGRGHDLSDSTRQLQERLKEGKSVCVFLEGTTSSGDQVRPFFAPMLQPAIESGAAVVPVGLRYSASRPDICIAEDVAYWKDHTLLPHAFRLFGLRGVRVEIVFGRAQESTGQERKAFAAGLHDAVEKLCFTPVDFEYPNA